MRLYFLFAALKSGCKIQHWHTKLKARVQGNAVNSPYELAPPTLADRGQAPFSFLLAVFRYFFDCEMPTKTDLPTRSRIKALLPLFRSNKKLLEELEKSRKTVSLSIVERIRAEKKKEAQGWRKLPKRLPDLQKPLPDRKRVKKRKVHDLSEKQKAVRYERGKNL